MNIYAGIFLSAVTGTLLALSGLYNGIFAWIAFVPVGIALESASVKRGAIYGFVGGVCATALLLYGVISYGAKYYCVLIIYNALQGGLAAACYVVILKKVKSPFLSVFIPPLAWVVFEYFKTIGPVSFPMPVGASQYAFPAFLQFAAVAGVCGLTLIILWVNRAIVSWITKGARYAAPASLAVFLIFTSVVGWGSYVLKKNPVEKAAVKTSILQGNIPIELYWKQLNDPAAKELVSDRYFGMSEEALSVEKPDILVWPEGAIYDKVMEIDKYKNRIIGYAKKYNSLIVIGTPAIDGEGRITNSAYAISDGGKVIGRYDKVRIVPFLEGYGKGKGYFPVISKQGLLGIVICFESMYPQAVRKLTMRGAEILFFLTNDCGLANSPLPALHANDAIIRAVETRRYAVMANQYGVSFIADPFGRVLEKYDGREPKIITGFVSPRSDLTVYALFGDYIPLLSLLVCLLTAIPRRNSF